MAKKTKVLYIRIEFEDRGINDSEQVLIEEAINHCGAPIVSVNEVDIIGYTINIK